MTTTVHAAPVSAITIPKTDRAQYIWLGAFRDAKGLSRNVKLVGFALSSYMDKYGRINIALSTARIAEVCGWSEQNRKPVADALNVLEASGWIERASGASSRTVNRYVATVPADLFDVLYPATGATAVAEVVPVAPTAVAAPVVAPAASPVPRVPAPVTPKKTAPKSAPKTNVFEALGPERHDAFVENLTRLCTTLDERSKGKGKNENEGTRLYESLKNFGQIVPFATALVTLVENGWGDESWEALTDVESKCPTAYSSSRDLAAVAWTRLKPLAEWKGDDLKPVYTPDANTIDPAGLAEVTTMATRVGLPSDSRLAAA